MQHINLVYFSATGGTEKIARRLASAISGISLEVNLTNPTSEQHDFDNNSIAIVAAPVYMGRVAVPALEALRKINGNGCRTISIITYGNRHYDSALVELNDTLTEQGFQVIASGTFIAEHSLVHELAAGRPNEDDLLFIDKFAKEVTEKINSGDMQMKDTVPGERPYIVLPRVKSPIAVSDNCTKCGICAEQCPMGAIDKDNPTQTDTEKCIVCMRCAYVCPVKARSLPEAVYTKMSGYLLGSYSTPKENEVYF